MYEITVRGKEISKNGRFVNGSGVTATGFDLYEAVRNLEKMTSHPSPRGGEGFMVQSSLKITPPNWEPGSRFGTATLTTTSGVVIGSVNISY